MAEGINHDRGRDRFNELEKFPALVREYEEAITFLQGLHSQLHKHEWNAGFLARHGAEKIAVKTDSIERKINSAYYNSMPPWATRLLHGDVPFSPEQQMRYMSVVEGVEGDLKEAAALKFNRDAMAISMIVRLAHEPRLMLNAMRKHNPLSRGLMRSICSFSEQRPWPYNPYTELASALGYPYHHHHKYFEHGIRRVMAKLVTMELARKFPVEDSPTIFDSTDITISYNLLMSKDEIVQQFWRELGGLSSHLMGMEPVFRENLIQAAKSSILSHPNFSDTADREALEYFQRDGSPQPKTIERVKVIVKPAEPQGITSLRELKDRYAEFVNWRGSYDTSKVGWDLAKLKAAIAGMDDESKLRLADYAQNGGGEWRMWKGAVSRQEIKSFRETLTQICLELGIIEQETKGKSADSTGNNPAAISLAPQQKQFLENLRSIKGRIARIGSISADITSLPTQSLTLSSGTLFHDEAQKNNVRFFEDEESVVSAASELASTTGGFTMTLTSHDGDAGKFRADITWVTQRAPVAAPEEEPKSAPKVALPDPVKVIQANSHFQDLNLLKDALADEFSRLSPLRSLRISIGGRSEDDKAVFINAGQTKDAQVDQDYKYSLYSMDEVMSAITPHWATNEPLSIRVKPRMWKGQLVFGVSIRTYIGRPTFGRGSFTSSYNGSGYNGGTRNVW